MTALGDVVVGVVELVEAEARKLGSSVKGLLIAIVLILVAGTLVLGGLGWLVAAGYLQLRVWLPPAGAAAVMGLLTLGVAGGMLWYAIRKR
ncbi:MAG: hypothetical protein C4331_03210 [Meiothermus sp.]